MTRTHTKLISAIRRLSGLAFLFFFLLLNLTAKAQVVYENPQHEVYDFLYRQAQKGNILFNDLIQPISRKEIAAHLAALQDTTVVLTATERAELAFYRKEYSEFDTNQPDTLTLLKRDQAGRWRTISVKQGDFLLRGDPVIELSTIQANGRNIFKKANGLQFWGHAGKHIAFQAFFQDITESGDGLDSLRAFTPEPGIVKTENPNLRVLNYSDLRGNITYSWNNGSLTAGKDQLLWGYGEKGRIILSDKAPAYPFIRLDYQPLKWLSFNYSHAWLQSGIIDSARTYAKGNTIFGENRELYILKFMASHSLNFFPTKGLALSLGESMVYSDRLDAGYLFPLMFFKAYDHYASRYKITTGSNGQFFFQASSRDHIPKTHLYGTLFIDEIRLSEVFNSQKSRNQVGFNAGIAITDVLVPYLTLGFEYTRINPFVYNNLIPAQTYTSQNSMLGDWMGSNADRSLAYIKYTPAPRLKTTVQVQQTRKGSEGTLNDQYFSEPQPPFLFNLQMNTTEFQVRVSYEWINNLYTEGTFITNNQENYISGTSNNLSQFQFSIRFGL